MQRYQIAICGPDDSMRDVAEAFVRESFNRTYRATLRTFMPTLLVLTDASGSVHGVAGCRAAADEGLSLERWLSRPIDELLEERGGPPAPRADILELGDFACRDASAARRGRYTRDARVMAGYLPLALEIPALRDGAHEFEMS